MGFIFKLNNNIFVLENSNNIVVANTNSARNITALTCGAGVDGAPRTPPRTRDQDREKGDDDAEGTDEDQEHQCGDDASSHQCGNEAGIALQC